MGMMIKTDPAIFFGWLALIVLIVISSVANGWSARRCLGVSWLTFSVYAFIIHLLVKA